MANDLHDLSISELAGQLAARKVSPVELVEALIQRVEQYDEQTRAFITRTFDVARQQARAAEAEIAAGNYRGPMHGIPFALKDIYDTRGIVTSGHSRVFLDRIPSRDATTTARLYGAGAVLLGKLATHEMAHAGPSFDLPWPPARNPWSLAHFTGGSSSGSGAAVAAGMVPLALGSDTGGSIRGPASLCGIVGLMPTFGLVSRAGVMTNSYTFDHCGQPEPAHSALPPGARRRSARAQDRCPSLPLGGRSSRVGRRPHRDGRGARCPPTAGRGARRVPGATARQLLRREDHHRRERDLQRPPEEPRRSAQGLRRRLPLASVSVGALHRQRLRPGDARASPDDGGDGAALLAVRR